MAQEPRTAQIGQHLLAFARWIDNEGKPIEPLENELPVWVSSKPNVLSCEPSKDNPGFADCRALKLGDTELTATAKFDTGYGIYPSSLTLQITVAPHNAARGEIELSYGSVEPLP